MGKHSRPPIDPPMLWPWYVLLVLAFTLTGCPKPWTRGDYSYGPCADSTFQALSKKDTLLMTIDEKVYYEQYRIECQRFVYEHRPRATAGFGVLLLGIGVAAIGILIAGIALLASLFW